MVRAEREQETRRAFAAVTLAVVSGLASSLRQFGSDVSGIGLSRGRPCNCKGGPHVDNRPHGSNSDSNCYGAHASHTGTKCKPPWDRGVLLSAIGQCLKNQYPLATRVPPQLAVLVKQLEAQT